MSDIAIRVEGISKQYRLGQRERYRTLRDTLADAARAPARLVRSLVSAKPGVADQRQTHFWALQDVSFEVQRGEVIGIIGRNGAGKSTLLKILSRITEPTRGFADIHGRVGSLLEVGTGFHPELTGRENVFLNGAILGMRKAEIVRKFDEIVAFAEIDRFLDTPVKHYSSGMYTRLAFAVAAHLEPEILIVDEVLAVGDAEFQKKCLGKMSEVAQQGRTVLFVSHNLAAVRNLCPTAVLLNQGRLLMAGRTADVIERYTSNSSLSAEYSQPPNPDKNIHLRRVCVRNADGVAQSEVDYARGFSIEIEYEVNRAVNYTVVCIGFWTVEGTFAFCTSDYDCHPELLALKETGFYQTSARIPGRLLNAGQYTVVVAITDQAPVHNYDRVEAAQICVVDHEQYPILEGATRVGIFKPRLNWDTHLKA